MSKQILYFDQHLFNQLLVKRILQKDGHTVQCAADLEGGWQLALDSQPDLILLDMHLEGHKGGIHFARALRQLAALRSCPIILLTPSGETTAEIEALAAGASGFIYKPTGIREVQTALRAILEQPETTPVRRPVLATAYVAQAVSA